MPITSAAIIGGSSLLSGVIGGAASSGDRSAADAARQNALQQFLDIDVPDPAQQKVILQKFQSTGQLDPQLEKAFNQSQTELNNVQVDPSTRAAQMSALAKMQDISNSNGMDAQARATNQQAINTSNTNAKGQRDAIMQNFAQRGEGGSGAQLQAQLLASQQDANSSSSQGLQAAASAQQRALQALSSGATLAGNINSTDYSQAAQKAQAQDAINRFNTANSQTVANSNVGTLNSAAASNLAANQSIANANTGIANQQETQNVGTVQQNFQNQMNKAAGASGQYGNVATQDTNNANATAGQWAGIGSAVAQGAAAYGAFSNAQKKANAGSTTVDDNSTDEEQ